MSRENPSLRNGLMNESTTREQANIWFFSGNGGVNTLLNKRRWCFLLVPSRCYIAGVSRSSNENWMEFWS
jgi:hypothetical protein